MRCLPLLTFIILCAITTGTAQPQSSGATVASAASGEPEERFVPWRGYQGPPPPARLSGDKTCDADDGSRIDMTDFRFGPVDPSLWICFDSEILNDWSTNPDASPMEVGAIEVRRGDDTVYRRLNFYHGQVPGPFVAVEVIGLVQPVDPQRGPFLLIVHVAGASAYQYDVVDLGTDGTPEVHWFTGANWVHLDVNEDRVISMSSGRTKQLGADRWGAAECLPGDERPPGDGLYLKHYTRFDFATGESRTWKRCEW